MLLHGRVGALLSLLFGSADHSEGAQAGSAVVAAVTRCRFEAGDSTDYELVLLGILDVLKAVVQVHFPMRLIATYSSHPLLTGRHPYPATKCPRE
jgi:hypothetical protein